MLALLLPGALHAEERADAADAAVTISVSTTLLGSVVRAVAGPLVELNLLIPPRMCPGHFALTPQQAARIAASDVFLTHGFEPFMRAAGGRFSGVHHQVQVRGNTMVPVVHRELAVEIRDLLIARLPQHRARFEANAAAYAEAIQEAVRELRPGLALIDGLPVLSAAQNRELTEWMGVSVAASFPRDEALTPQGYRELLDRARAGGVRLVIDNLQSSGRLGHRLANALDVPLVVISNFPDSLDADAYPAALRAACSAVLEAAAGDAE